MCLDTRLHCISCVPKQLRVGGMWSNTAVLQFAKHMLKSNLNRCFIYTRLELIRINFFTNTYEKDITWTTVSFCFCINQVFSVPNCKD
jgi:hypothetical protein